MRNGMMIWLGIGIAALVCCKSTAPGSGAPTVYYRLVPHACSSTIPVTFFVDAVQVGTDTFRVAVAGGDHLMSPAFPTSVGTHVIGAKPNGGSLWPDTSVTLSEGAVFVDSLQFSCS